MKSEAFTPFSRGRPHVRAVILLLQVLLSSALACAQDWEWSPRGAGGGGSMFAPSINPSDDAEFFVGCDMSGLYHTTDFGATYAMVDGRKIQGGHNSAVQFTNDPHLLYCISYANDMAIPVKSTDAGQRWDPLPGNPDETDETYSIAVDHDHPSRVIISTYGSIASSTDGGTTFSVVHTAGNPGAGINVGGAFFDDDTVYLGTNDGVLVSRDGARSFSTVTFAGLGPGERIFSFAGARAGAGVKFFCLTADSNDVYVGVPGSDYWGFMKGVYSLDPRSGTWVRMMNGITADSDYLMYVVMARNDTSTVYLGGSSSSGEPNIMKSADGGFHWNHVFLASNNQNIRTGWSGDGGDRGWGYGECVFGLAVAPENSLRVLFTDFGFVHTTTDAGATWRQAYCSESDDHPAGQPTPKGRSYHSVGLEVTSCWQIVWSDADDLFAAYTDIHGVRSTDAGSSWSFNYSGIPANTIYRVVRDPESGTLFAATSDIHDMYQSTRLADAQLDAADADGKIIASTDMGAHWSDIHFFGHPVFWAALDPNNAHRMYASVVHSTAGGIFVTDDLQDGPGSVWTKLPNPPRTEGHPAALAVLRDGSVLCTYSGRRAASGFTESSGVFLYSPAAKTWSDCSDPGMDYWTMDVVIDPHDTSEDTWYAGVFSGWGGPPNGLGGLYRTTNRGAAWVRICNLDRVTSCTINPVDASELFLTTETDGLWRTADLTDPAPAFTRVESYPFSHPERVFYNPYNINEIWVTSFGGGMMVAETFSDAVTTKGRNPFPTFELAQNYPNPFNPATTIRYTVQGGSGSAQHVLLKVYDALGAIVATLVDGIQSAGEHTARWQASTVSSGIYFYRLRIGSNAAVRKMIFLK